MVQAVVFDWGGTLSEFVRLEEVDVWGPAARRLVAAAGVTVDPEHVRVELYAAEERFWSRLTHDPRGGTTHEIVLDACRVLGITVDVDVARAAAADHWDAWDPHVTHHAEVAEALGHLRERGIRIGLLSNTHWPGDVHDALLHRDGLLDLLDARTYTSELAWMKPHPEAFAAALAALGATPSETVFVGDRPFDDISGAKAAGMRAVLRPNQAVPHHPVEPDAVVEDLLALVDHVDRWRAGRAGGAGA